MNNDFGDGETPLEKLQSGLDVEVLMFRPGDCPEPTWCFTSVAVAGRAELGRFDRVGYYGRNGDVFVRFDDCWRVYNKVSWWVTVALLEHSDPGAVVDELAERFPHQEVSPDRIIKPVLTVNMDSEANDGT